jgi:sulfatase modifying factor 1
MSCCPDWSGYGDRGDTVRIATEFPVTNKTFYDSHVGKGDRVMNKSLYPMIILMAIVASTLGATLYPSAPGEQTYRDEDLNGDGWVNYPDFALLAHYWMKTGENLKGDIDKSGEVTLEDLRRIIDKWLMPGIPDDFVLIPSVTFDMGSPQGNGDPDEHPVHKVFLDSYIIGKSVITNGQFYAFLQSGYPTQLKVVGNIVYAANDSGNLYPYCTLTNENKISFSNNSFSIPGNSTNLPMVCVSWYGAVAYCNWRSQQEARPLCYNLSTWECNFWTNGYRLVTEAEWEYAARIEKIVGNVYEWCNDWYSTDYYSVSPKDNPTGPQTGTERIVRGGWWYRPTSVTYRGEDKPKNMEDDGGGIRMVLEFGNPTDRFDSTSNAITNPWLGLKNVGESYLLAGSGSYAGATRTLSLTGTGVVKGIQCLILRDQISGNGSIEDSIDDAWIAQDTDGNLRILKVAGTSGDWEMKNIAYAAIVMPKNPFVGEHFSDHPQSSDPGFSDVLDLNDTVSQLSTGAGPYTGCMKIKWTNLIGDDTDYLWYSPDAGLVKDQWDDNGTINGWERLPAVIFGDNSDVITNPWLGLKHVGDSYALGGYGTYSGAMRTLTLTDSGVVQGVKCLIIRDKIDGHGLLDDEIFDAWIAQDTAGNLRVLKISDTTEVLWQVSSATDALIIMPGSPYVGQRFYDAPMSDDPGYSDVMNLNDTVPLLSTGAGPYAGCLNFRWTSLKGNGTDFLWYCPDVGLVKDQWNDNGKVNGWERLPAGIFGDNSDVITNPWLGLKNVGDSYGLAGYGTYSGAMRTLALTGTGTIQGVKCLILRDTTVGLDNEVADAWIAQDTVGNLRVLKGTISANGQSHSWEVSAAAEAVIGLPGSPFVGQSFCEHPQAYEPGCSEVLVLNETIPQLSTGAGPYTGCMKIRWTNLIGSDTDYDWYCPNVGVVKEQWNDDGKVNGWERVPSGGYMVTIPGGSFQMGDSIPDGPSEERPVHQVTVDSFNMGKYEITNGQYCAFLNSAYPTELKVINGVVYATSDIGNGTPYCDTSTSYSYSQIAFSNNIFSVRAKNGKDMSNHPIACVRWNGAVAYCNWLSQKEGRQVCYDLTTWTCNFTKKGYRLPTEAEWEYAARGGSQSGIRFPWGDTITHNQANYNSLSQYKYDTSPTRGYHPTWNDGIMPYTSTIGSFPANGYGLCDMIGNAWEWCNDWYGLYSSGSQTNPKGPETGSYRVLRGGGWYDGPDNARVSVRYNTNYVPYPRYGSIGFRIVLGLN